MEENPYQSPQSTGATFEPSDAPPSGNIFGRLFRSLTRIFLALVLVPFALFSCGGVFELFSRPSPNGFACVGVVFFISVAIIYLIRQIPR